MKKMLGTAILVLGTMTSYAEMRTWTLVSGETVEGDYDGTVFEQVILRDHDGTEIRIPLDRISAGDRTYIDLVTPPELKVDFLQSAEQVFVKPSPMWADNSPVSMMHYKLGARVRQLSTAAYRHNLTVEIYAIARQVYDPDKYHLVLKWSSEPFRLDVAEDRRLQIQCPRVVKLAEFLLTGEYPRGQSFAESVVVVRDERGMVVACQASKKWLSAHIDRLTALPEGAWFNDSCHRVHPTSPKAVWFD